MNTQIFQYNGNAVTFRTEKGITYINATDMARPFGKRPVDYLRLPSTNELVKAVVRKSHSGECQAVITECGGTVGGGGTWLHEDVALDFAQWLSVDFRLWCLARLKELLMTGVTTVRNDDEAIAYAIGVLQRRLTASKERVQQLAGENTVLKAANEALTPKARFADAVATSAHSCLIGELAKILRQNGVDIGQNRLFEWLRRNGYLCSRGDYYNQPTQRAVEMGLLEVKKTSITKPDGSVLVSTTTKVTGKGQIYFVNKFLNLQPLKTA